MSTVELVASLGAAPATDLELALLVEGGLPTDSVSHLRDLGLNFTEVAEIISPRTLKHRKARGEDLSGAETDRIVRVARILALASRIFANREKALLWLRSTDEALQQRTPLSLLHTEFGGRLVESLLWQIDEGIYT